MNNLTIKTIQEDRNFFIVSGNGQTIKIQKGQGYKPKIDDYINLVSSNQILVPITYRTQEKQIKTSTKTISAC